MGAVEPLEVVAPQPPLARGGPATPAHLPAAPNRTPLRYATWFAATLLLVWPAAWNGYPLIFADTGTYLGQTLLGYLGWDRPPFYSTFLYLTHWKVTLWLPVLVQAAILAHLLGLVLRVQGLGGEGILLLAAAALTVLTSLPWFVAQLMPDCFTGVVVVSLWLLGFRAAALRASERLWLLLLATGAVAIHQSHLPLALGLGLGGSVLLLLGRGWRIARVGAARMLVPSVLAALAMLTVNAAGHGRASLSPFGSVFFATRLIYDGPGMDYLRRACPEAGYRICPILDRLSPFHNAFLWHPESPLYHVLKGPKAWAPEAAAIISGTLHEAPVAVARAMLENAVRQFCRFGTGDGLEAWPGIPGPEPLIASFFPHELEGFQTSRQERGLLAEDAQALSPLHVAVAVAGLVALVLLLLLKGRRLGLPSAAFGLFVLAAAVGNATIAGGLSGPAERYQARIAWLFAFAPSVLVAPALRRSAGRVPAADAAPAVSVRPVAPHRPA